MKTSPATLCGQMRGAVVVAKKNARLYYLKPPVLIFGVLFPIFFFLAFKLGRPVSATQVAPGIVAMALWFTASAVGPLVTPWERRAGTWERLISSPIAATSIAAGDVLSGLVFGIAFTLLSIALCVAFTGAAVVRPFVLAVGVLLGATCFSTLGVLMAAPPVDNPSHIMMLSNLVRLPMLFISGVFVPIAAMPAWARVLSPLSPLSYATDLLRVGFGQTATFPVGLDCAALALLACVMFLSACRFHRRWRAKGM